MAPGNDSGLRPMDWVNKIVPWAMIAIITAGVSVWMDVQTLKAERATIKEDIAEIKGDIKTFTKDFQTFLLEEARRGTP